MLIALGLTIVRRWDRAVAVRPDLATDLSSPGKLRVRLSGPAGGSVRFTLVETGSGCVFERTTACSEVALFEPVEPATTFRLIAKDEHDGSAVGPRLVRSPERLVVSDLICLPTHDQVLIDFHSTPPVQLAVAVRQIGRGDELARLAHHGKDGPFRQIVMGLKMTTDYALDIRSRDAWGGIEGFRFRTLGKEHADRLASLMKRQGWEESSGVALSLLSAEPDARAIPNLLESFSRPHQLFSFGYGPLVRLLRATRDPRLAGRIPRLLPDMPFAASRATAIAGLARPGATSVFELATALLEERQLPHESLALLAEALATVGDRRSLPWLGEIVERLAVPSRPVAAAVARTLRSSDVPQLESWLASPPGATGARAWAAILALGQMEGAAGPRRLLDLASGAWSERPRAMMCDALSSMDRPDAGARLRELLSSGVEDRTALWELVRARDAGTLATRVPGWLASADPRVRADAVVAAALADLPGAGARIAARLDDP
ncbi:MAG: hypothetical protein HY815_26940, partial [Candidatus Riflebacteria bacterium]|nr:hypothetical protein [Candidatus Riflebacteria bacterium]